VLQKYTKLYMLTLADATHFLSKVTSSMLHARRSLPTPLDFKYALEKFDLPIASIEPHLKPPIPLSRYLVQLEALPVEDLPTSSASILLEPELSGEPDKNEKVYIPKNFPSFPSKHTYKWTEKESARETNPRKIREEAAKAARQGEEALRRLTRVSKAGKEKDVKKVANKDPKSKERHEVWERTMDDLFLAKPLTGDGPGQESDQSMIVNANSPFFRKGAPAKRKPPLPIEI
jgi:transcription initiation factor TFIID subunit 8